MFKRLISGFRSLFSPHFVVGKREDPYLLRWYLIPRNRWFNLYLHKFCRDDDDRALHDHPWWFVSLMIRGRYTEVTGYDFQGRALGCVRTAPSIAYRSAKHQHRVILSARDGKLLPCWTIVLTGPRVREWGFWCPQGFVPWYDFVSRDDHGTIGPGCGDG